MKKILLSTALLSLLTPYTYANDTPIQPTNGQTTSPQIPIVPPTINCAYRIPADTTNIDEALIKTWAKAAAIQSFTYQPDTLDKDIAELKSCYTDQGFVGFNDAMQKSGNFTTIKTQQLAVKSEIDGDISLSVVKENQWKVTVPIKVVYQSAKEKLTQQLSVDLLIGRKMSGDLGVMQMIATPQRAANTTTANTTPTQ